MREGDRVAIGDPANPSGWVECGSVRGDRTRIVFEFPHEVPVNRLDVVKKILDAAKQGGGR